MPRETLTAPLTFPVCWTSVGSRTSTTSASPARIFSLASAGDSFGTAAFACASISFTLLAMAPLQVFDGPSAEYRHLHENRSQLSISKVRRRKRFEEGNGGPWGFSPGILNDREAA